MEQSVEMPVAPITDRNVLDNIVGRVEGVAELAPGFFEVKIGLAVATTGRNPRVVVSRGILATLGPAHQHVLLAHEGAHLRHHHHAYLALVALAAAADPLLGPVRTAVADGVERWADDCAARSVGSRRLVAGALVAAATTAVAADPDPAGLPHPLALPVTGASVPQRVHRMLEPVRAGRWAPAAVVLAVVVALAGPCGAVASAVAGHREIEEAERAYTCVHTPPASSCSARRAVPRTGILW